MIIYGDIMAEIEEWNDKKVAGTMILGGIVCGIMLWLALGLVAGNLAMDTLPGAILGGIVTGWVMHLLG
jgi:hypothetical protein